jgi:hypothetical protein
VHWDIHNFTYTEILFQELIHVLAWNKLQSGKEASSKTDIAFNILMMGSTWR